MFVGNMRPEPTPERVYALYKIVEKNKTIQKKEVQKRMEPEDEKTSYFSYVLKTASDLEIVNDENNVLSLKEGIDFGNINDFRAYVCKRLNTIPKSHFCLVTKTIIDMNSDVLKTSITDNALVHNISKVTGEDIRGNEMLGWRFWAQFLGFGVMQDMIFIPNSYTFLKTILKKCNFPLNTKVDADEFVSWMMNNCEAVFNLKDGRNVNLAFSSAMRQMHVKNELELIYQNDAKNNITLYPSEFYFKNPVSSVIYKGDSK